MVTAIKGNATSTFGGNVDVTGNVITDALAFSAYSSGSQSISNATNTKVTYDVEDYDTGSCFSSSRFTPTVAGYYNIYAYFSFIAASGLNQIQIYKNGSQYKVVASGNSSSGYANQINQQIYLNGTTDYVEVYIYQNSGGSANITGGQSSSAFQGYLARSV